ncbi:MAG: cell division protein FtsX [Chitinophagales bacterium]|nr:cell division protein FtsX [Chitinophagales bacterium]
MKRNKPSYINVILSVTLVLFILGLAGLAIFQAKYISDSIKENIEVQLELQKEPAQADMQKTIRKLESERYVKAARFVSKKDALIKFREEIGEDPTEFLDFNPLYASYIIHVKSAYANPDSMARVESDLMGYPEVKTVLYQKAVIDAIDTNLKKAAIVFAGVCILFLLIAITLIDSTIRLAMFSNRFLIRSMQLVGATRWFIIKPFVARGVFNGLISGILAGILLIAAVYFAEQKIEGLTLFQDLITFASLIGGLIIFGVLLSWFSTHRAVLKYLRLKLDDLY